MSLQSLALMTITFFEWKASLPIGKDSTATSSRGNDTIAIETVIAMLQKTNEYKCGLCRGKVLLLLLTRMVQET